MQSIKNFKNICFLAAIVLSGCGVQASYNDGEECYAEGQEFWRCEKTQYCDRSGDVPVCVAAGELCEGSANKGYDNKYGYCLPGASCQNGKCELCKEGQILCDQKCINPQNDRDWCGAKDNCLGENAGMKCKEGEICTDSKCFATCLEGQELCGDACVILASDPNNCGQCGNKCPAGNICTEGQCSATCLEGQELCGDACVTLSSDPNNCGECGNQCPAGYACLEGNCFIRCMEDQTLCSDECIDLKTNSQNCGECGNQCDTGFACVDGNCSASCPQGQVFCDQNCINPQTDNTYCGAALGGTCNAEDKSDSNYKGETCSAGRTCTDGVCHCTGSLTDCNGSCTNTQNDKNNCGTCGNICSANGQFCDNGECVCAMGYTLCEEEGCVDLSATHRSDCQTCIDNHWGNCDGDWSNGCEANLLTDTSHCGVCDQICTNAKFCDNGECSISCVSDKLICDDNCIIPTNSNDYCGATLGGNCNSTDPNSADYKGIQCKDGQSCIDAKCVCPSSYAYCKISDNAYQCMDASINPEHCGCTNSDVGINCYNIPRSKSESAFCKNSQCNITCEEGYELLDSPFGCYQVGTTKKYECLNVICSKSDSNLVATRWGKDSVIIYAINPISFSTEGFISLDYQVTYSSSSESITMIISPKLGIDFTFKLSKFENHVSYKIPKGDYKQLLVGFKLTSNLPSHSPRFNETKLTIRDLKVYGY